MTLKLFYFVADYFPAWRSDVIELFGRALPSRGLSVTWSMRRSDAGVCCKKEQGGQSVYLPFGLGRGNVVSRLLNRPLESLCEVLWFFKLLIWQRHEIIQVRDDRYTAAFWAWLAARLTGARFVYWLSFPFPENDTESAKKAGALRNLFLKMRARLSGWWLYRVMLPRADHVFVQSEQMKHDLYEYGLPLDRMTPVPMGVPDRLLEWSSANDLPVEPGLVAYVGTLAASRHLTTVIEAFAIVQKTRPDSRLIMVGEGDFPHERTELEVYSKKLGLDTSVSFTGFIPMEEAWKIAACAAVGLSPFYPNKVFNVASPTKVIESMALARPVVVNRQPEQSEIIAASGAGLCVEWGAATFAEAILWLLDHPEEGKAMGKRGAEWVAVHRTYSHIADQIWRRYQSMLRLPT